MKSLFAGILIASFSIMQSNAQQKVGFEAGLIYSNYAGSPNNYEGKPVMGIKAGFAFNNRLADDVFLQLGLCYLKNGYMQTYTNGKKIVSVQTVEVPVYFQFPLAKNKGYGMSFGIGPYMARNFGINVKYEGTSQYSGLYATGSTIGEGVHYNDIGVGANFLYEFKFGLYFRAHGQVGLTGISNPQIINNRNFGISIGYMIDTSPPKASDSKHTNTKHHSGKSNTRSKR